MTEVAESFPELGAKSPEKIKPKSAPRGSTRGRDNNGKKPRERKEIPDDGAPLIPPAVIAEPSQEEQEAKEAKIKAEIEDMNKKVEEINEAVEKAREDRTAHNEETKEIREELRELRAKSNEIAAERDALVDKLKKHSEGTKQLDNQASKLRKELRITDSSKIDEAIKEMTTKLETSSMDLKSEKALVFEIKKVTAQKEQLKEWEEIKAKIESRKEAHEELYKKRQEVGEKLTASRDAEKVITAKLDAFKTGEGFAEGVAPHTKMMNLMDSKTKVIDGIKAKRGELKEMSTQFKLKIAEYREYTKAQQAYERKVENREWNKRRAERAEKQEQYKLEQKERDAQRKAEKAKMEARFAAVAKGTQMFVGGVAIRATDEQINEHFKPFGEILDYVVVRDNETKISKGFAFVTMANKEDAEKAIKECHNTEVATLCPPHGRISVKMAEKSKRQLEWEADKKQKEERAKAAQAAREAKEAAKEAEAKEEKKAEKKEEKKETKEDVKEEEEEGAEAPDDDFFAAFAGGSDKVEMPAKVEEKKVEEKKEEEKKEGDEEEKKDGEWKATRTEWVKEGEEEEEAKEEDEGGESTEGKKKKKKSKK